MGDNLDLLIAWAMSAETIRSLGVACARYEMFQELRFDMNDTELTSAALLQAISAVLSPQAPMALVIQNALR